MAKQQSWNKATVVKLHIWHNIGMVFNYKRKQVTKILSEKLLTPHRDQCNKTFFQKIFTQDIEQSQATYGNFGNFQHFLTFNILYLRSAVLPASLMSFFCFIFDHYKSNVTMIFNMD